MLRLVLVALIILPLAACKDKPLAQGDDLNLDVLTIITKSDKHSFNVELALDIKAQGKGLMGRESMAEDAGMLFYFQERAERNFWMKNTLIPLDIMFLNTDGTIHHIYEQAMPHDLTRITSNGPVRAVLEINGGLVRKHGIQKGDVVKHPFFSN